MATTEKKESQVNIPFIDPEKRGKIEDFYNKYKKTINYALYGVIIVVLGYLGYTNIYVKNKEREARTLMYKAESYFKSDSFELALNGKAGESFEDPAYGFLDIIDEYSMTKTGNLAKYYAGICFMRLADRDSTYSYYEDALDYLKDFKTDSEILKPFSLGAIGDCYSELEEYDKAADYYVDAAECKKNKFTTPYFYMKAGIVLEELEEYEDALEVYEKLKNEYPRTQSGMNVEKYIGRVTAKLTSS